MIQAQSSCTAFWRGREHFFELALYEGFVHFWEPDSPQFQAAPEEWRFCAGFNRADLEKSLPDRLKWAFECGHYGRRIRLSDQLTIFVRADGYAFIRATTQGETKRAKFFAELDKYVFAKSHSEWIDTLEAEARNHTLFCEGGFGDALHNLQVTFAKGEETQIHLAHGDAEDFARLAELIFQLEPSWIHEMFWSPKNEGNTMVRVFLHCSKPLTLDFGGWDKFPSWNSHLHPRHKLWQVWADYFAPSINLDYHQTEIEAGRRLFEVAFAVQSFQYDWENDRPIEPSQHERMEIVLPLGKWLRERAGLSNERINELLP